MRSPGLRAAAAATLLALGGCAASVDQFSNRAQAYNDQADTIKEQQLLLNIMRAAYREPMEFSDFTQVTGQNALSGTLGFSLPISAFPTLAPRTYLTSPSATVSGTQSFTVANLDTQAFYEGLLSPIPLTTLDYYMESNYPKALVLTLFVDKVKLIPMPEPNAATPAPVTLTYDNSYQYGRYRPFRAVIDTAIFAGLNTEIVKQIKPVGPPMSAAQLNDVKDLASLTGDGVTLRSYEIGGHGPEDGPPDPKAAEAVKILPPGTTQYYRLVKTASIPRFCFDAAGAAAVDNVQNVAMINTYLHSEYALPARLNVQDISIPQSADCGIYDTPNGGDVPDETGASETTTPLQITLQSSGFAAGPTLRFRVAITTRSVEQMLYYLGEWTRAETGLAGAKLPPPLVSTAITAPGMHIAEAPLTGVAPDGAPALPANDDILFQVNPGGACPSRLPSVHVTYFGSDYCMQIDPTAHDRSAQVMEIVSQLFALNNAASNLPSPNVISVLSQ